MNMAQMIVILMMYPLLLSAHDTDNSPVERSSCCGDIPESLIWLLSLLILIGILMVVGSYFWIPEPLPPPQPVPECRATSFRIEAKDIDRLAKALHKLNSDDSRV
jgi:hypothetical protein